MGSGVVSIQGFLTAYVGEIFKVMSWQGLNPYGMVVNLYRDETMNLIIGSLLFDSRCRVTEGSKIVSLRTLASIVLGDFVIGSILDSLGNLILTTSKADANYRWVIESPAPGIIERQSVFEPLQTGIISIDSMVPIGLGQRELVVGDRQSGKTSIAFGLSVTRVGSTSQRDGMKLAVGSTSSLYLNVSSRRTSGYTRPGVTALRADKASSYLSKPLQGEVVASAPGVALVETSTNPVLLGMSFVAVTNVLRRPKPAVGVCVNVCPRGYTTHLSSNFLCLCVLDSSNRYLDVGSCVSFPANRFREGVLSQFFPTPACPDAFALLEEVAWVALDRGQRLRPREVCKVLSWNLRVQYKEDTDLLPAESAGYTLRLDMASIGSKTQNPIFGSRLGLKSLGRMGMYSAQGIFRYYIPLGQIFYRV